jgi:hypothetical protein
LPVHYKTFCEVIISFRNSELVEKQKCNTNHSNDRKYKNKIEGINKLGLIKGGQTESLPTFRL